MANIEFCSQENTFIFLFNAFQGTDSACEHLTFYEYIMNMHGIVYVWIAIERLRK